MSRKRDALLLSYFLTEDNRQGPCSTWFQNKSKNTYFYDVA